MRIIDADKLHVDKQINGECWINQEQIINAPTVDREEMVLKALEDVKAEIEEQIDRYDDRNISEYEDCLAIIDRKIAEVKGDKE